LKFDKTGIGHDMAKEFTNNWWDLAYAKASSGIQIEENQDGDTVEIKSKKKNRKRKNKEQKEAKKKLYSGFVKSATLTNGELKEDPNKDDNEEDEDDEIVKIERLSDEDLFKAVGGFTGHKLARHGVKESAKLKRIEAMDKRLLLESTAKNTDEKMEDHNITTKNNVDTDSALKSKMKKKKKKSKDHQE